MKRYKSTLKKLIWVGDTIRRTKKVTLIMTYERPENMHFTVANAYQLLTRNTKKGVFRDQLEQDFFKEYPVDKEKLDQVRFIGIKEEKPREIEALLKSI